MIAVLLIWLLGVKLEWTRWLIVIVRNPRLPAREKTKRQEMEEMNRVTTQVDERTVIKLCIKT